MGEIGDYEKKWNQLKIILEGEETRYSRKIINVMEGLEKHEPIALFTKHKGKVKKDETKGLRKFFKR